MIILLGIIFVAGGKINSVVFDKEKVLMEVHKRSVLCINKKKVYDLTRVENIRCVKKGHDGINFYTIHYEIQAEFRNEIPIKILESTKRELART